MSLRRAEILALVGIVIFISLFIAIAHRDDSGIAMEGMPRFVVHSSYSTYPGGYKALYLTLEKLGYPVHRQIRPYPMLPARGLLIVADPYKERITTYEARELLAWVERGNYVLAAVEHHPEFLYMLSEPDPATHVLPGSKSFHWEAQPWWRDGITKLATSDADVEEEAHPAAPSFLADASPTLAVRSHVRFPTGAVPLLPEEVLANVGSAVPLYSDQHGPAVLYSPCGDGGIVWTCSPWMFSNAGISRPGNLELVLRLADLQPGTPVIFDDYHHGYGAGMTVWSLMSGVAKLGVAKLALALVLLLITLAWRFGVPRLPDAERFSRSRAEYLTSMAGVLERAGATHVVRDRLQVLLRRELGRRLGLSPHAPLDAFLETNRRGHAVDQAELERVARRLESVMQQTRPAPEVMLRLTQQVHALLQRR